MERFYTMIPAELVTLNPMASGVFMILEHNITRYNTINISIAEILSALKCNIKTHNISSCTYYRQTLQTLHYLAEHNYISPIPEDTKLKDRIITNVNLSVFDKPKRYVYLYNKELDVILDLCTKDRCNLITLLCYLKLYTYHRGNRPYIYVGTLQHIADECNIERHILSRCINYLQNINLVKYHMIDNEDNTSTLLSTFTYKLYTKNNKLITENLDYRATLKSGLKYICNNQK